MELIPGGRDLQVTETNVFDYVRKYAEYRMIKTQEKALEVSSNLIRRTIASQKTSLTLIFIIIPGYPLRRLRRTTRNGFGHIDGRRSASTPERCW